MLLLQFVTRLRGKTAILEEIVQVTNGEQKAVRSSTNSSTRARQTFPILALFYDEKSDR
jgi:hypothetical protein